MKFVDLSLQLSTGMPVYPGAPPITINVQCTIEKNGFRACDLIIDSHAGTHIDAPAHMVEGREMMEELPLEQFFGSAFMMDVSAYGGGGEKIPLEEFKKYEDKIQNADFLIINSGWHKKFGGDEYNHGFPNPTKEAAQWIAGLERLKGVGIDMPTIDHHGLEPLEVHRTLMRGKKIIIENLTNLSELPETFLFSCFPLSFKDAEGSPCRAIAIVDAQGCFS